MYSVQFTVYSVQCTVYSVECIVYNVQCKVYRLHQSRLQSTVWSEANDPVLSELHCVHYTKFYHTTLQCTLANYTTVNCNSCTAM